MSAVEPALQRSFATTALHGRVLGPEVFLLEFVFCAREDSCGWACCTSLLDNMEKPLKASPAGATWRAQYQPCYPGAYLLVVRVLANLATIFDPTMCIRDQMYGSAHLGSWVARDSLEASDVCAAKNSRRYRDSRAIAESEKRSRASLCSPHHLA